MASHEYETITFEVRDGVAWLTLNRPERHNAFNSLMQREVRDVWRTSRFNEDVRCVVVTGAGEKAFCTGIDRMEQMGGQTDESTDFNIVGSHGGTPFHFNDPGDNLGPKSCDFWKPVIAAVNGMACGGAFYMLGEVEFVIASDDAVFFDPHVTYGMTAAFEPIQMLSKMPFPEIMRLLKEEGAEGIIVFAGGIIPEQDIPKLKQLGIRDIFLPGTPTSAAVNAIRSAVA